MSSNESRFCQEKLTNKLNLNRYFVGSLQSDEVSIHGNEVGASAFTTTMLALCQSIISTTCEREGLDGSSQH